MEQWPVCFCLWLEMETVAFLSRCQLAPHEGPRQSAIKLQSYNGEKPHSTASFKCNGHLSLVNGQQKRKQCKSPSLLKEKHVGGDPGETLWRTNKLLIFKKATSCLSLRVEAFQVFRGLLRGCSSYGLDSPHTFWCGFLGARRHTEL